MFEFFMSVLGGLIATYIGNKFDLDLYVKSLVFLPKKMAIKSRWKNGRKLVHKSRSSFLVLDYKSSLFIDFMLHLTLLIVMWLLLNNMDFSLQASGTVKNPNAISNGEQSKLIFSIGTWCYSLFFIPFISHLGNEYSLVREHYLKKGNAGLRENNS